MDKNIANILLDTEFEENNEEEYTTIIESYRCSTSTYNHQNSIYSLKTSPITPPPKSQIINYKKKSSDSLEKLKSNHILINNLNECIENLKIMLSKKKSSQNVPKHTNKNFKLNDENKHYAISDVSSFDLNEENL